MSVYADYYAIERESIVPISTASRADLEDRAWELWHDNPRKPSYWMRGRDAELERRLLRELDGLTLFYRRAHESNADVLVSVV